MGPKSLKDLTVAGWVFHSYWMLLESPAKARLFRGETSAIFPDDLPMILPVDPHVISSKMTVSGYIVVYLPL